MKSFIVIGALSFLCSPLWASIKLSLEGGQVWQWRNDLQRPQNSSATRLALDEIDQGPKPYYRVELFLRPNSKHGFRLLYAPLSIEVKNTPESAIRYNGEDYIAGEEVTYFYQFNSYRLTYFYAFRGHGDQQFNLGFTGKIRDAETRLTQGNRVSSYDNVGFVPLLYLGYQTPISPNWLFHFSFDGLAGGPGRAFDFTFKLRRKLGKVSSFGIGTRTLEGGVDNDKVYNFSWLQYGLLDLTIGF